METHQGAREDGQVRWVEGVMVQFTRERQLLGAVSGEVDVISTLNTVHLQCVSYYRATCITLPSFLL